MKFNYKYAGVTPEIVNQTTEKLSAAPATFIASPEIISSITTLAHEKQALQPTLLVVIGIGGSSLGALAVYEALYAQSNGIRLLCADTVDATLTQDLYEAVREELQQGGQVLLMIVSKSGKTTETLVNAALFVELLKEQRPQTYQDFVVVITDSGSPLWDIAETKGYAKLEIPQHIGGRFSVFTAAGLFPLAMAGIEIEQFCAGAEQAQRDTAQIDEKNHAATSAAVLYHQYQAGKHIHDTFVFTPYLASFGAWYRQLLGESIGKRHNKQGNEVCVGITPTVSVGSNDLHSVAQLYLGGPYDKITTFVHLAGVSLLKIPQNEFSVVDGVQLAGKSISVVQDAIFVGTCEAYVQDGRPFMHIELEDLHAFELGYLMQIKMFEIIYLGFLLDINVFDQPQVELYKKVTRQLLTKR